MIGIGGPGSGLIGGILFVAAVVCGTIGLWKLWHNDDPRFTKYLVIVLGYLSMFPIGLSTINGVGMLIIIVWCILLFPFCLFLISLNDR